MSGWERWEQPPPDLRAPIMYERPEALPPRLVGGPARVTIDGVPLDGMTLAAPAYASPLAAAAGAPLRWQDEAVTFYGALTPFGRRWFRRAVRAALRRRRPRPCPWKAAHARRYPRGARR